MRTNPSERPIMTSGSVLLAASLVAAVMICNLDLGANSVEARYLPTRSDKSEIETLKGIIRGLLAESDNNAYRHPAALYPRQSAKANAAFQRRAAEMSLSSSNGDETEGFLTSPYESVGGVSGGGGQPFRTTNPRPDR